MAYVSLYRKYRSQSFGEVVGQDHVTTVLQNAIRMGRIAHAYLFCGPRGCGKTSTARLLARALNCQSSDSPTPDPCGTCDMCVRIREGTAMDVVEMDAASETGIDDVREKIIENARYSPAEARYKVYIIDEVHDLSLKAFDSLLKTIEEPPAHVVFVLATTELHKVPVTIRSRCQRMDFRRGTFADLCANLRRVLDREEIAHEPEAVAALAAAAEGSFRDSLSLLEQVLAYTDGALTAEAVHAAVGTVGPQVLDDITAVLASDDMKSAFAKAGELVDSGKDVKQIAVVLQAHFRDLLVAGISSDRHAMAEVSDDRFAELKRQSASFTSAQLLRMLDVLAEAERETRFTNQHRILLERTMWRLLPSHLAAGETAKEQLRPAIHRDTRAPDPQPVSRPATPHAPQRPAAADVRTVPTAAPAPSSAPAPAPSRSGPLDLEELRRAWPRVRQRVVEASALMRSQFTEDVRVIALKGNEVVLGCPNEFVLSRLDKPRGREFIEKVLSEVLGVAGLKVRCMRADPEPARPDTSTDAPHPALDIDKSDAGTTTKPGARASVEPGVADVPGGEKRTNGASFVAKVEQALGPLEVLPDEE